MNWFFKQIINLVDTQNVLNAGNKIAFFAADRSNTDEEMAFIQPRLQSNSGGAGNVQHFVDTFKEGKADAALAASVFHFGEIEIVELKQELRKHDIEVRL